MKNILEQNTQIFHHHSCIYTGRKGLPRFKSWSRLSVEVRRILAGMGNSDGGTLVLGVMNDENEERFPYPEDKIFSLLQDLRRSVIPPLDPGVKLKHMEEGKLATVELCVEASPLPHRLSDGSMPLRLGSNTLDVDSSLIESFQRMRFSRWYEEKTVVGADFDDLDPVLIAKLLKNNPDWSDARRLLTEKYGLILPTGEIKRCALLLLAREPGMWLKGGGGVEIVRIAGKKEDGLHNSTIRERIRFDGPILRVIEDLFAFLDNKLKPGKKPLDIFYSDEYSGFPSAILEEALINALAHRDYSVEGLPIEILSYDDSVVIRNPGSIHDPVTIDMLLSEPGIHISRNPRICRVLSDAGYMRCIGGGISMLTSTLTRELYPPPEISSNSGSSQILVCCSAALIRRAWCIQSHTLMDSEGK